MLSLVTHTRSHLSLTGKLALRAQPSEASDNLQKNKTRVGDNGGDSSQGRSNCLKDGGTPNFRLSPKALAWVSLGQYLRRGMIASRNILGQQNSVQVILVHSVSSRDSHVCTFTRRWKGDVTRFKSIPNLMTCDVPNLSN